MVVELGEQQEKFAEMIWEKEPVASGDLVKYASEQFGWKKPTTYTVLRKLCEKGLFQNHDGIVTSIISKKEFAASKSHKFVDDNFAGSLPSFIAAFAFGKTLSKEEVDDIQEMIDCFRGGKEP